MSKVWYNLSSSGQLGRKTLAHTIIAPLTIYPSIGWINVRVSDVAGLQSDMDKVLAPKFMANSRYLNTAAGGYGAEHVFSRHIAMLTSNLIKSLYLKNPYYENLNKFLKENLKLKLDFFLSHGTKISKHNFTRLIQTKSDQDPLCF